LDENQDDLRLIEGWEVFVLDSYEGAIIEFKTFDSREHTETMPIGFSTEELRKLHAELGELIQHIERGDGGKHRPS
jgi:hypothetical protein